MFKRGLFGAMLVGTVVVSGAIAQAATRHHVSQTIKLVAVSQSATFPNPGSRDVDAGIVSGTVGRGAIIQKITITGHPTATTYTFKGTNTSFLAHGTIRSSFTGVATAQANGGLTVTGHGHYTGGTNAYLGARGKYAFSGAAPPATPGKPAPLVGHITGTLRY
jgi:hypothetical protein